MRRTVARSHLVNTRCPEHIVCLRRADDFFSRLRGLLFTRRLPRNEGMLLCPCNSVHMVGMLYALDIVYLDADGVILKMVPKLPPFALSVCRKAAMALELPAGMAADYGWRVGDRLVCCDAAGKEQRHFEKERPCAES